MSACMQVRMCTTCVPGAWGGQERVSEPIEPELQIDVSCHDQGEAFGQETQGSQELAHPRIPGPYELSSTKYSEVFGAG